MKAIRKEFVEILKPISITIDEIINIDIEELFDSFGTIKQKIYNLIYKNILYIPISENAKMLYLEHINFMFTEKKYYSNDNITVIGINNYNDLNYIVDEHIEFINKTLDSFSKEIGKKARENKDGIINFLNQYIYELKRLSILKEFGIRDISKERPFDDFYLATIENELLLQKELNSVSQKQDTKPSKKKALTTYIWLSNSDKELPVLYNRMKEKFLAETDFESFRAIFTGQPVQSVNPIRWHDNNASELLYFNHTIRSKVNPVKNLYQRMKSCFIQSDGNLFNANFKNLFQNIDINLSENKQQAINELIENL
jgi:hypothetical protein